MLKDKHIPIFELVISLTNIMDFISPSLVNHHKQVAYIAYSLGEEMDLSLEQRKELLLAGALHDIGALSIQERIDALNFEVQNPFHHAEAGYKLLKTFEQFSSIATLVRFHHVPWDSGKGAEYDGQQVPIGSHILHLADRVAVLIDKRQPVLGQCNSIIRKIEEQCGKLFMPELVDVLKTLAGKEYFWLDVVSQSIVPILRDKSFLNILKMDLDGLQSFAKLFSKIIDFRNPFTANHSSGVAATAETLARLTGYSELECRMMKVAGYLHDLGKLAIPTEILEKPRKLTKEEFTIIKSHSYYTFSALAPIDELDIINRWASFHHERLDGKGYPFHLKGQDLPLGSRIMAVADVFTAITEDRPYREGMKDIEALKVLQQMVSDSALDANIVSVLQLHYDEINSSRLAAQEATVKEHQTFLHSAE